MPKRVLVLVLVLVFVGLSILRLMNFEVEVEVEVEVDMDRDSDDGDGDGESDDDELGRSGRRATADAASCSKGILILMLIGSRLGFMYLSLHGEGFDIDPRQRWV